MIEYITFKLTGQTRKSVLHGRDHIVANATLIVPGVLNGSKGPLFYPPEEVARDPDTWNGIPIVVWHPKSQEGNPISGRLPHVLNEYGVGTVFNAKAAGESQSLQAELWFDTERTNAFDNKLPLPHKMMPRLLKGQPIELSTGLYTENIPAPVGSVHNDRSGQSIPYTYVARNYKPDHLAVLPDQRGACSVGDGCGVNVIANQDTESVESDGVATDESEVEDTGATSEHNGSSARDGTSPTSEDVASTINADNFGERIGWFASVLNALLGQPHSANTGRFKAPGSGTGRGDVHSAAQSGAMHLTDEQVQLGTEAYAEVSAKGHNPVSWVADDAKWEKAKAEARKSGKYKEGTSTFWAVVVHIYENMGGKIKKGAKAPTKNVADEFNGEPWDGESFDFDTWEPLTENAKKKLTGGHWVTTEHGNHVYIKSGNPVAGNPHVTKEAAKGSSGASESSPSKGNKKAKIKEYEKKATDLHREAVAALKSGDKERHRNLTAAAMGYHRAAKHVEDGVSDKVITATISKAEEFRSGKAKLTVRNSINESFDLVINEAESGVLNSVSEGSTMPTKAENITYLTTNCDCWKGKEAALNGMSDAEVETHRKFWEKNKANEEVVNTVRKKLGVADSVGTEELNTLVSNADMMKTGTKETSGNKKCPECGTTMKNGVCPNCDYKDKTMNEGTQNENKEAKAEVKKITFNSLADFEAAMPPEAREVWENSKQIVKNRKFQLIEKLTANCKTPELKKEKAEIYLNMKPEQLEKLASDIQDTGTQQSGQTENSELNECLNFIGIQGPPAVNQGVKEKPLTSAPCVEIPVLNYEELSPIAKKLRDARAS